MANTLFQFTPLREGRRRIRARRPPACSFQFTPLREGRLFSFRPIGIRGDYFNSRPSARGDGRVRRREIPCDEFQFTPLREGRRKHKMKVVQPIRISIHAPPRGATSLAAGRSRRPAYFNSRPSARGDRRFPCYGCTARYFNSRPSARGDAQQRRNHQQPSIFQFTPLREGRPPPFLPVPFAHAFQFTPLREGRPGRSPEKEGINIFQFTPLREGRRDAPRRVSAGSAFQFTPLREGRREPLQFLPEFVNFNSRPSARGDGNWIRKIKTIDISIHAPPRGATRLPEYWYYSIYISIHAPPRGATRLPLHWKKSARISIHAPPRGATDVMRTRSRRLTSFQFTPLREGRRTACAVAFVRLLISIHAPPRGATMRHRLRLPPSYFNSRPSARGDAACSDTRSHLQISIHAPPRGATLAMKPRAHSQCISIHAPPRGATANLCAMAALRNISIHAPPRGATAKDMQFLQIFCSTLTNQHGLTIVPRNLSRLFW